MRRTLPAVVAAAALALSACGGGDSPSDEQKIRTAVREYFSAFSEGDGAKACAYLTTETRARIVEAAKTDDCADAMKAAAERPDVKPYVERFRDVEVLDVKIAGAEASAKVRAIGQETTVPLEKEEDDWKLTVADAPDG